MGGGLKLLDWLRERILTPIQNGGGVWYARFKGVVSEDIRYVCSTFLHRILGRHNSNIQETFWSRTLYDLESKDSGGWKQHYNHTTSRVATSGRCGLDSSCTKQYIEWCGFKVLYQLSKRSVCGLQLRFCLVKSRLEHLWKRHVCNRITSQRGCLAC